MERPFYFLVEHKRMQLVINQKPASTPEKLVSCKEFGGGLHEITIEP